MNTSKLFLFASFFYFVGIALPASSQTWDRKRENDFRNVVAIVKPRRTGACRSHQIRSDGRVYDAFQGTNGSYLIVDQVVSLTGIIDTNSRGRKVWQVFYEPSRTVMWLDDCDVSIPRLAN